MIPSGVVVAIGVIMAAGALATAFILSTRRATSVSKVVDAIRDRGPIRIDKDAEGVRRCPHCHKSLEHDAAKYAPQE